MSDHYNLRSGRSAAAPSSNLPPVTTGPVFACSCSRTFTTLRGLKVHATYTGHALPSHEGQPSQGDEASAHDESPAIDNLVRCPHCSRGFTTVTGLGLHRKSAHLVEFNAEIEVDRLKPRWTEEESRRLARAELHLQKAGVRFMNQELHQRFPGRTLESIKGHRKQASYKAILQAIRTEETDLAAQQHASASREVPVNTEASNGEESSSRTGVVETIQAILEKSPPVDFQGSRLWEIAHMATEGLDIAAPLNDYIRDICFRDQQSRPSGNRGETHSVPNPPSVMSRRKRKAREYARIQELFRRRQADCARQILNGPCESQVPDVESFLGCWEGIISNSGPPQVECASRGSMGSIIDPFGPVSSQEIKEAKMDSRSAPGPDGFTARDLFRIPVLLLRLLLNLLVLVRRTPVCLRGARTIFVPKKTAAKEVGDFRPITIAPVLLRLFHKILAKRLMSVISFDVRQRAFRPVDGCAENVMVLATVLHESKTKCKPLYMASVDLSKAFDSVSFSAIFEAAVNRGLSADFVNYLRYLYEDSSTVLTFGNRCRLVKPGRGVRQGDPLSPVLFNLVLDTFLQDTKMDIAFRSGHLVVDAMAFADDLLLFASTRAGLQERLDSAQSFFASRGLSINTKKSFTLSLIPSGRDKKVRVTESMFSIGRDTLPASETTDLWRYLGINFSPRGMQRPSLENDVTTLLQRIRKAPLKPQQRLVVLRFYLLPRLYHRLMLGPWTAGLLWKTDKLVRASVRSWLKLPHDVPLGYYHAAVADGGLGIPSLRTTMPVMKHRRLSRLAASSSDFVRAASDLPLITTSLCHTQKCMRYRGENLCSKNRVFRFWARCLHQSNDGGPLKDCAKVPFAQKFVSEGTRLLPGRHFIDVNKLRINALPTLSRVRRGRDGTTKCRAGCDANETLSHVLQHCHRTHAPRIRRHDNLVRYAADVLQKKGWEVLIEPHLRTSVGSVYVPDIVATREDQSAIIDAQVVGTGMALDACHSSKILDYSVEDLLAQVKGQRSTAPVVTSLTLNFRGVWAPKSAQDLLDLGVSRQDLKMMTVRCLQGGVRSFKIFNRMTSVLHYNTGR